MSTEETVECERPIDPTAREAVDDSSWHRSPDVHERLLETAP